MDHESLPMPSIAHDLGLSALFAVVILGGWGIVYHFAGDAAKLNSDSVNFIGGVLAVSGLLFRQYMLKEVLEYLKSWDRMSKLLGDIIDTAVSVGRQDDENVIMFIHQKEHADAYGKYVKMELTFVPIIPIITIFFYGCALISEKNPWMRFSFMYCMILCVTYLALVAITSSKIVYSYPDINDTIQELEALRKEMQ